MQDYMAITKALSDETRVRALVSLADGELCVCQIIEVLGLSPSTVSKHMSILQQAGLIERRKDGRWHYYRLAGRGASPLARQALRWTLNALDGEKIVAKDAKALCCIRKQDREELTACYNAS
jgi:ArsR family transcriptional regulator, arsenate/arsenite/antimonite-responsive transcriptional repressor